MARPLQRVLRGSVRWVLLPTWYLALALVAATLMARHLVPLPSGALDERLAALRTEGSSSGLLVVHVLYAKCRCSERIVHHLAARGRIGDVSEVVLWVGSQPALETMLEGARFPLVRVAAEDLAPRFGIQAAPLLAILDAEDRTRYRGGYTDEKQAYTIRDTELVREAASGAALAALPLFGCAVARELERIIDPLRLF